MLLSKYGKLVSVLFFVPLYEVFIGKLFEAETEVSLEENTFDKVLF